MFFRYAIELFDEILSNRHNAVLAEKQHVLPRPELADYNIGLPVQGKVDEAVQAHLVLHCQRHLAHHPGLGFAGIIDDAAKQPVGELLGEIRYENKPHLQILEMYLVKVAGGVVTHPDAAVFPVDP